MTKPMDTEMSDQTRHKWINEAAEKVNPLVIIGGGITGAGILLDAASRGIDAFLIEQNDFSSGTSSKSTKLVHGGLRYLKNFELGMVRKVGHERKILHQNAPYLVKPAPMLLPIKKNGSLGCISAWLAVSVYEKLIGVKATEKHRYLNRKATIAEEPLLITDDLLGGIIYTEYQTQDSRLTLEVMKTAISLGGRAANYLKVISINKITEGYEIRCEDRIDGRIFSIRTRLLVNAAGPWLDLIRQLENPMEKPLLTLSKGVHLVISRNKLPLKHAVYFDTPDRRMVFAIPRGGICYIGTTETLHEGNPSDVNVGPDDIRYLTGVLEQVFHCTISVEEDVLSSWAGLRPLVAEPGKAAGEISRKDEVLISPDGMISIAGGKLTGYRIMAEEITDLVCRKLNISTQQCKTAEIPLIGMGSENPDDIVKRLSEKYGKHNLSRIEELVSRYGVAAEEILSENSEYDWLLSELAYCKKFEMLVKQEDFWHRSGDALYRPEKVTQYRLLVENEFVPL